jgi:CheY-like chemotaxis protein
MPHSVQQFDRADSGTSVSGRETLMSPADTSLKTSATMLVIDDDEVSLAVLTVQLSAEGFTVIPANSGEQALEKIHDLPREALPTTALVDLNMPGLSGSELAQALHEALPQTKLLAMSATAANVAGYDAFVIKPLEVSSLHAALSALPSTPPAQNEPAPALREEIYTKLLQTMPRTDLHEVYKVCLRDARQRIAQMQKLAEQEDFANLRRQAHTIKGGAAMVGAARLAAAAASLETGSYERSDLLTLIYNLLLYCDELERILQRKTDL